MSTLNIYQRINEVRKRVAYIQKDAKVQTYAAVTHDQVTSKIRDALIEFGIIIIPKQVGPGTMEVVGKTTKGGDIYRFHALYEIRVVNADDPQDRLTTEIEAHANDTSDKAPGKTISYAVKTIMLKLFTLETGLNDESRMEPERQMECISDEQIKEVKRLITKSDADKGPFLRWMQAERIEDIQRGSYAAAIRMLKKKLNERDKALATPKSKPPSKPPVSKGKAKIAKDKKITIETDNDTRPTDD